MLSCILAPIITVHISPFLVECCSIQVLAGGKFISTVGFMLSDVTTDAIVVERSKHEQEGKRGSMQAIGYSVRFTGR